MSVESMSRSWPRKPVIADALSLCKLKFTGTPISSPRPTPP